MASDREITLGDVGRAIWRGKWIIVVTAVVGALVGLVFTFATTTRYTASSTVYLGQATTVTGALVSTPGTNPLTAATMLTSDRILSQVALRAGVSRSVVRDDVDITVPRAPGTVSSNQPAVATITASTADAGAAVRIANAYAQVALSDANTGFVTVKATLAGQVAYMGAEQANLVRQIRQWSAKAASGQAAVYQPLLFTAQEQLTNLRVELTDAQIQLARADQIEAPSIVSLPSSAASSGSAPNRVRTMIVAGLIGLLLGTVIALVSRGGLRRGPATS